MKILFANNFNDPATSKLCREIGLSRIGDGVDKPTSKVDQTAKEYANTIFNWSERMHKILDTASKRGDGKLFSEGFLARYLADGDIKFRLKTRASKKRVDEIHAKSSYTIAISQDLAVENEGDIEMVQLLADVSEVVGEVKEGVVLVDIDNRRFRDLVPTYINQLRDALRVKAIPLDDILAGVDPELSTLFKRRVVLTEDVRNKILKTRNPSNVRSVIVVNDDAVQVSDIRKLGYEIVSAKACRLIFRGRDGRMLAITCNLNSSHFSGSIGMKYSELMFDFMAYASCFSNDSTFCVHGFRLSAVHNVAGDSIRDRALTFFKRMMAELSNRSRGIVAMVIHAPKGRGKTTFSAHAKKLLSAVTDKQIFIIDSDNYGRMRMENNTYESMMGLTWEGILRYNDPKLISRYDALASALLVTSRINTYEQYMTTNYTRKAKLFKDYDELVSGDLLSGLGKLNEDSYYTKIFGMVPVNTLLIIESHTVSRDAVLGPTNLTAIYESVLDSDYILQVRDAKGAAPQRFLHDYYERQIGDVHAAFNIHEFNSFLGHIPTTQ